jgi:hypothetical protein
MRVQENFETFQLKGVMRVRENLETLKLKGVTRVRENLETFELKMSYLGSGKCGDVST